MEFRIERDSMGDVEVPVTAYYGASTQRAQDNFPISQRRFSRRFIWALGLVKGAAATVSGRRGYIDASLAAAIESAADEVVDGRLDDQFVLDVFQTGSGTSTNTNANEVIANRATEILGGSLGDRLVHPNDHVNYGQSSNDVIPTAMYVAVAAAIHEDLLPSLGRLETGLRAKAHEFADVVKSGRTHLMDATPVTLGQEFSGYATQVGYGVDRLRKVVPEVEELALGGTAVGTGLNAPTGFPAEVISVIASKTGIAFREARDHFEAQAAKDAAVAVSGSLKTIAVSLFKIANDLRWLSSGPRTAISEIQLPSLQPGSSIMPGKVNPVMPEMMMQVAAQVIGNDAAITWGGANGNFELNVMMPMMIDNLLESVAILSSGASTLQDRCVEGIEANADRARELVEKNIIVITSLNPHIGYDKGAEIAKEAFISGRNVRDVALEMGVMTAEELDAALDLKKMTEGGILG